MVLCEIILTANQILGLGLTFIMVVLSIVTLILKINQSNQKKFDCKLDVAMFREHERAHEKDYKVLDDQLTDIYKELEFQNSRSQKIEIFMNRIDENLKHINQKLDKL